MTGESEDFQIIDSSHRHTRGDDNRLDQLREIYQNETCKNAIHRTRRAESNAKALEVILEAQVNMVSEPPQSAANSEELLMEIEDKRSLLISQRKELEKLRLQVNELKSQQSIDYENIESLQQSLERLHRVSGEYRNDRDKLSNQLIGLFNAVKNSNNDHQSVSMEELKENLESKKMILTRNLGQDEKILAEENLKKISVLESLVSERDVAIIQLETTISSLKGSIDSLSNNLRLMEEKNESVVSELEIEKAQILEYEVKIKEWSDWAETVTVDLESRNKEIELLEQYKEHATEEIMILEERVKELMLSTTAASPAIDHQELSILQSKIIDLESERTELEKKIYDWSEWANSMTSQSEQQALELSKLANVQQDFERIEAEKLRVESELISVQESVADLTIQINANEMEIVRLKSIEDELKRAESTIANLNDQLLISENLVNGAVEQIENERSMIQKECEELKAKILVRDSTISALSLEIDQLKQQDSIHQQTSDKKERIESLEAELVVVRDRHAIEHKQDLNEIHSLKSEIAILNETVEKLNLRQGELEGEKIDLINELESIRIEMRTVSSSNDRVVADLRSENERMREEIEETIRMSEGRIQKILEDQNALRDQLTVKEEQLGESRVIADRLREQIRMLEDSGQGTSDEVVVRLEAERSDMEQKLLDWNKWADEVTAQLAERDATIADLMSAREHLDDSLRQAEELRNRVAELESTAVERDKNLSDNSPIGRTLDKREENSEELEKANNEIALLREELRKAGTKSPGAVSPEEAEVLLDAYRAEIDRLSKENSKLRTEVKKAAPPLDRAAKSSSSTNSWWNVLPDIEEPEGLDDLNK